MREIKTFTEFLETKTEMHPDVYVKTFEAPPEEVEDALKLFVYGYGVHIEKINEREYRLQLLNNIYTSEDIEILEERLWNDFYSYEMCGGNNHIPSRTHGHCERCGEEHVDEV